MRVFYKSFLFTSVALLLLPYSVMAREQIRVVGSSTVYPFVATVAEVFGKRSGFKTPVVEATGTGSGVKLFCSGVGEEFPDIANASRHIKDSELALCRKHGVHDIMEIKIGYDGIVIAQSNQKKYGFALTSRDLFLALAREVPVEGILKPNPYHRWRELNTNLPDIEIAVYGPPPTSGTRDAFVELVMERSCAAFPEFAAIKDEKERKSKCGILREDGRYVEMGENDNLTLRKLEGNPDALGIFGYSYYEENKALVHAHMVDGALPEARQITSGRYPVSRSMYVYVKLGHKSIVPGIMEFAREMVSESAIGESGYLTDIGLIPLAEHEFVEVKQVVEQGRAM